MHAALDSNRGQSAKTTKNVVITDNRQASDFGTLTFSNYRKSEVVKALISGLRDGTLEASCYWSVELICAGHFMDMWNIIIDFYGKYIHGGNPRLAILILNLYSEFRHIALHVNSGDDLDLRNGTRVRELFCELICVLSHSHKMHPFVATKIGADDFELSHLSRMMIANSNRYSDVVILPGDPKELTIAVNELMYNLSPQVKHVSNACYWVEWIIAYDTKCRKQSRPPPKAKAAQHNPSPSEDNPKNKPKYENESDVENEINTPSHAANLNGDPHPKFKSCTCVPRSRDADLSETHQQNIIWIVWDAFFKTFEFEQPSSAPLSNKAGQLKILTTLHKLFSIRYTPSLGRRRRWLIYFAVNLICIPLNLERPIVSSKIKQLVSAQISNVDIIYGQVVQSATRLGVINHSANNSDEPPADDRLHAHINNKLFKQVQDSSVRNLIAAGLIKKK